jgi:hypothetical protein
VLNALTGLEFTDRKGKGRGNDVWLSGLRIYSRDSLLSALLLSDRMQAPKVLCRCWGLAAMVHDDLAIILQGVQP